MSSNDRQIDPFGAVMQALDEHGLEYFANRYYGMYRAIVLDDHDPDGRFRLRLQIPDLGHHESADVPQDYWALPCMLGMSGAGGLHGVVAVPKIGEVCWVQFEHGTASRPVWMGGWLQPDPVVDELVPAKKAQPIASGLRTLSGSTIRLVDGDDGKVELVLGGDGKTDRHRISLKNKVVEFVHEKGHAIAMTEDGITVRRQNGSGIEVTDDVIVLTVGGTSVRVSSDGVEIVGKSVLLSAATIGLDGDSVGVGKGAVEPAMLGGSFAVKWQAHSHGVVAGAPLTVAASTLPPMMVGSDLSKTVRIAK